MSVTIFIGLLCLLGETYSNQLYGLVWKHFIKNNYPRNIMIKISKALSITDALMIKDELAVWEQYLGSTKAVGPIQD
jgi:hypothetical protein